LYENKVLLFLVLPKTLGKPQFVYSRDDITAPGVKEAIEALNNFSLWNSENTITDRLCRYVIAGDKLVGHLVVNTGYDNSRTFFIVEGGILPSNLETVSVPDVGHCYPEQLYPKLETFINGLWKSNPETSRYLGFNYSTRVLLDVTQTK
jgi:hypothetical protein